MVLGDNMKIINMLSKSKKAIGGLIAIILVLVLVFFTGMKYASNNTEAKVDSTTIRNQLTEINEVAYYSYDYTNVGKFSNKLSFNGWNIPLTQKSFLITYDGSIKAGFDFNDVDVHIGNSTIDITLSSAKILSHEINESSIEVYDESSNIFNPISINDYKSFASEEKKKNEKKAIKCGILDKAKDNAIKTITAYLQAIPEIKDNYKLNITIKEK